MKTMRHKYNELRRFRASEQGARLTTALLWGGSATLLGRGLPLLAMMLTARLLGAEEFGKLTLLFSTVLALEVFVTSGLAVTCTKYVADLHRTDPQRTGRIIDLASMLSVGSALMIGVIILVFGNVIAVHVLATPSLLAELYWASILVAILAFSGIQQGILIGVEAFRLISMIELAGGLFILILMISGGVMFGMQGAFAGLICGYFIRFAFQYTVLAKQLASLGIVRHWTLPKEELPMLWRFSLPAMLNSLIFGPIAWLAIAIIVRQANGPAEIGIFYAANQWYSLMLFLPTMLNQVAFPIMTERLQAGDRQYAWRLYESKIWSSIGVVSLVGLVVCLASPFIMDFYGPEYSNHWPVLCVVVLAAWISAPLGPMGNLLIAHTQQWDTLFANIVWAFCLLTVVTVWREHGAFALAWSYVCAYIGKTIYTAVKINQLRRT